MGEPLGVALGEKRRAGGIHLVTCGEPFWESPFLIAWAGDIGGD